MGFFKPKPKAQEPLVRKNVTVPSGLGYEATVYYVKSQEPTAVSMFCRKCREDISIDHFIGHECATVKW
jgi:hypothetical protein